MPIFQSNVNPLPIPQLDVNLPIHQSNANLIILDQSSIHPKSDTYPMPILA